VFGCWAGGGEFGEFLCSWCLVEDWGGGTCAYSVYLYIESLLNVSERFVHSIAVLSHKSDLLLRCCAVGVVLRTVVTAKFDLILSSLTIRSKR
jgi:hypothetical protein